MAPVAPYAAASRRPRSSRVAPLSAILALLSAAVAADGTGNAAEPVGGAEQPSVRFAAIGDWGAPLTSPRQRSGQKAVADGLASWLEEIGTSGGDRAATPFIVSLGDNFYPSGVKDSHDMKERCAQTFDDVYSHDAFDGVPWYVVAGNKDYEGDITAQMGYSGSTRWIFPDYFHKVVPEVDGMKVEIIAIDTMQLSNSSTSNHGLQWVEKQLSQSEAQYLIVAGHFPAHLVPGLNDLLPKYMVSAYISGHIHCQRHERRNGVYHFISGSGMEMDCSNHVGGEGTTGGFLSFDANASGMVVRFHDQSGKELRSNSISPRTLLDYGGLESSSTRIA